MAFEIYENKIKELLNALRTAEEALIEWHDETTLPYITAIIDRTEKELQNGIRTD
jgi:hypothetical protein